MEWVETTGRSIDEAKDAALDQLGVDENEAEFEILEEPTKGLFGRVRGEARIRARIKPTSPRPKVERRDRARRGKARPGDDAAATDGEDKPKPRSRGGAKRPAKKAAASTEARSARARKAESADGEQPKPRKKAAAKRAAAPARRPAREDGDAEMNDAVASSGVATEGRNMSDDSVTVAEQADLTAEFLGGLLDAFGVQGSIDRQEIDEETIELAVSGDDLGLLIGPKGQTLMAVHELSRTYVQRKAAGHHEGRVRIDVGGYRQRRREALERFTQQVAAEVKSSGVQKALEPMVASDRKVVHDAVNAIDGVRTISEGEDLRRRVVIIPE